MGSLRRTSASSTAGRSAPYVDIDISIINRSTQFENIDINSDSCRYRYQYQKDLLESIDIDIDVNIDEDLLTNINIDKISLPIWDIKPLQG